MSCSSEQQDVTSSTPIRIAITMGDPAGIGPEIIAKVAEQNPQPQKVFVVYGSPSILLKAFELYSSVRPHVLEPGRLPQEPGWSIYPSSSLKETELERAKPSKVSGQAALDAINDATDACLNKQMDAMVTAPVSKEAIEMSEVQFDGHTGWIAERCQCKDEMMLMHSDQLNVAYATTHIALRDLKEHLTTERILTCLKHTSAFVHRGQGSDLPIGICGLNPHAGENGLFGDEEHNIIQPAIEQAQALGIPCSGPHPADTIFVDFIRADFSAILALYHDQGGIPFKMLAFDTGVNLTMGLPIIRTSVDHGTAWNIAWQGKAQAQSLQSAIQTAMQLIQSQEQA